MKVLKDRTALKYTIKDRYLLLCTRKAVAPQWGKFYDRVAAAANCGADRIKRIVNCRRDELVIALRDELVAIAKELECSPEELAAEAAERTVMA